MVLAKWLATRVGRRDQKRHRLGQLKLLIGLTLAVVPSAETWTTCIIKVATIAD
jgi:hypothetical protein